MINQLASNYDSDDNDKSSRNYLARLVHCCYKSSFFLGFYGSCKDHVRSHKIQVKDSFLQEYASLTRYSCK